MNNMEKRLHHYDNKEEQNKETLTGHLDKEFLRVDDDSDDLRTRREKSDFPIEKTDQDSVIFGDLFRSFKSGNSNYVTYLKPSIDGKNKGNISLPTNVVCLKKKMDKGEAFFSEVIGSRLANLLGVETVYNVAIPKEDASDETDTMYDYLLSVDYVPWGYMSENLALYGLDFSEYSTLETIMNRFDSKMDIIAHDLGLKPTQDRINQLKKDIAKQYLYKVSICEDDDFQPRNMSLIYNTKGDFKLGPCFDMEYVFYGEKTKKYYISLAKQAIDYLKENMPDVLNEFVSNCHMAIKTGAINDVFENSMEVDPSVQSFKNSVHSRVLKNIQTFNDLYQHPEQFDEKLY